MEQELPFAEMEAEIGITLQSLRVPTKKLSVEGLVLGGYRLVQFKSDDFGTIVSVIQRADYGYIHEVVQRDFPGYRYVYVSTFDNLIEKRDEIIWSLMEGGYLIYIRQNFPRQFQQLITDGFGNKIIRERLRRWDNAPKFKFFIDENTEVMKIPVTMMLSREPAFFDYMP